MKKIIKIIGLVSVPILLAAGLLLYKNLPKAIAKASSKLLTYQGFSHVHVDITSVGLRSASVAAFEVKNDDFEVSFGDITLGFELFDLLESKRLKSVNIQQVDILLKETSDNSTSASKGFFPGSALESLWNLPVSKFNIGKLQVTPSRDTYQFTASLSKSPQHFLVNAVINTQGYTIYPNCTLQRQTFSNFHGNCSLQLHLPKSWPLTSTHQLSGSLHISNKEISASGTTKAIDLQILSHNLPQTTLDFRLSVNESDVSGSGRLGILSKEVNSNIDFTHNFQNSRGRLKFQLLPLHFEKQAIFLSQLLIPWTYPFDVNSGEIEFDGILNWHTANLSADWDARLTSLSGIMNSIPFTHLSTRLHLSGTDSISTKSPAQVKLESINPGLVIEDMQFSLELNEQTGSVAPAIVIQNFQANLLGGSAHAKKFIYSNKNRIHRIPLQLKGIDVAQLVALEGQQKISATGTLDGYVPLQLDPGGISIEEGKLQAREQGGLIQLRDQSAKQSLAAAGANMDFVLSALENYQYNSLVSSVNYKPDGTLLLGLSLKGKNPELNKSRPLHFNINVEENIPALLKTLRISQGLEEKLVEGMKKDK